MNEPCTNLHANRTLHQLENVDKIRNQIVKQLRLITLLRKKERKRSKHEIAVYLDLLSYLSTATKSSLISHAVVSNPQTTERNWIKQATSAHELARWRRRERFLPCWQMEWVESVLVNFRDGIQSVLFIICCSLCWCSVSSNVPTFCSCCQCLRRVTGFGTTSSSRA